MGVPAFFKWLAAKYPLILETVVETAEYREAAQVKQPENGGTKKRPSPLVRFCSVSTTMRDQALCASCGATR